MSKFIVEKISGCEVQNKNTYEPSLFWQMKTLLKCLLHGNGIFFREVTFFWEKPLMAVGSILSKGNARACVWGSGFMNENEKFRGGKVYAVRGPLSDKMLKEQGWKGCGTWGDPAYLLPLLVAPAPSFSYDISIIPHFMEYDYFQQTYGERYHIIDLRQTDVKKVINEITSSRKVLSTSLHGLIVSHAYGIPALWIKKGYIETDGTKFKDYFGSVNIPEYKGFESVEDLLADEGSIETLFCVKKEYSLPRKEVKEVQRGLLKVAPFPVCLESNLIY